MARITMREKKEIQNQIDAVYVALEITERSISQVEQSRKPEQITHCRMLRSKIEGMKTIAKMVGVE